jgi:periplasmic divalent cation tolerance protein
VNIVPGVQSVYRWEESVVIDQEALLVIKTDQSRVDDLRQAVFAEHAYDLPEFVVVSPQQVEPRYAAWIRESVASSS